MFERVRRSRSMPGFFARWTPDRIAGTDFAYRATPGLHATNTGRHKESLAERMCMPGRARARFKADPGGSDTSRVGCLDDGILPNGSRETRRTHAPGGPRSASDDVHCRFSPIGPVSWSNNSNAIL